MPNAKIVPRALQLENWPHAGLEPTDKPIVVHGPSNQAVKGTKFILKACEESMKILCEEKWQSNAKLSVIEENNFKLRGKNIIKLFYRKYMPALVRQEITKIRMKYK